MTRRVPRTTLLRINTAILSMGGLFVSSSAIATSPPSIYENTQM
jgi:hypothetical protein